MGCGGACGGWGPVSVRFGGGEEGVGVDDFLFDRLTVERNSTIFFPFDERQKRRGRAPCVCRTAPSPRTHEHDMPDNIPSPWQQQTWRPDFMSWSDSGSKSNAQSREALPSSWQRACAITIKITLLFSVFFFWQNSPSEHLLIAPLFKKWTWWKRTHHGSASACCAVDTEW